MKPRRSHPTGKRARLHAQRTPFRSPLQACAVVSGRRLAIRRRPAREVAGSPCRPTGPQRRRSRVCLAGKPVGAVAPARGAVPGVDRAAFIPCRVAVAVRRRDGGVAQRWMALLSRVDGGGADVRLPAPRACGVLRPGPRRPSEDRIFGGLLAAVQRAAAHQPSPAAVGCDHCGRAGTGTRAAPEIPPPSHAWGMVFSSPCS